MLLMSKLDLFPHSPLLWYNLNHSNGEWAQCTTFCISFALCSSAYTISRAAQGKTYAKCGALGSLYYNFIWTKITLTVNSQYQFLQISVNSFLMTPYDAYPKYPSWHFYITEEKNIWVTLFISGVWACKDAIIYREWWC